MQSSMINGPDADRAIILHSTFKNMFGNRYLTSMLIRPENPEQQETLKSRITSFLATKYKFDPEDEKALPVWGFIGQEERSLRVARGLEIILFAIGSITRRIAGVGRGQNMYVTVKERTRE